MGPQLFSRGYLPGPCQGLPWTHCFNGATAFQPWIRKASQHRMDCYHSLQWGHSFSAVDTGASFKWFRDQGMLSLASMGPQLFSRGYQRGEEECGIGQAKASMGPQLFSRGYSIWQWQIHSCLSFNGATAFQPWIREPRPAAPCDGYLLQWGHSFSAVDTQGARGGNQRRGGFNGATAFQPWILRGRSER